MKAAPEMQTAGGNRPNATKTTNAASIAPATFLSNAPEKIAPAGRQILTLDSARQQKELATLIAKMALAGHVVIRGKSADFNVSKWGLIFYAQDVVALEAFARKLGVAA